MSRYYTPRELEVRGIRHAKIMTEGHVVPSSRVVEQFYRAVEEVLGEEGGGGGGREEGGALVGVHCTHGLNRTGYLVCR